MDSSTLVFSDPKHQKYMYFSYTPELIQNQKRNPNQNFPSTVSSWVTWV